MTERRLNVRRGVTVSVDSVWALVADFPNPAEHWDGLKTSRPIGDQEQGVRARRRMDLKPFGTMMETVSA